MAYLIAQISLFLFLACAAGFVVGWVFRGVRGTNGGMASPGSNDNIERAKNTARVARAELAAKSERLSQAELRLAELDSEVSHLKRQLAERPEPPSSVVEESAGEPAVTAVTAAINVEEVLAAAGIAATDSHETEDSGGQEEAESETAESAPLAADPPPEPIEDLTLIKGIGPATAKLLKKLGYSSVQEIAAWTEADIARVVAEKKTLAAKITRDAWVDQARTLSADS